MRSDILKVFVGYDPVESVAWHTLVASIYERSSTPICVVPINLRNMKNIFERPRDSKQSNEFSISRFLVPYLMDYEGFAIFMDCDMLLRCDLNKVFEDINNDPGKAVYVVKHDYQPSEKVKYLNTVQYSYPRKNWSSFVVWNCGHVKNLAVTLEMVNHASPLELHRFTWLNDEEIGELEPFWNWLVGEYEGAPEAVKNVHWTLGGPYFHEFSDAEFSDEWFKQRDRMEYVLQRLELESSPEESR